MRFAVELYKGSEGNQRLLSKGDKDTDIFQSIVGDLKEAIVGKIKEKATGWIMSLVGLGPGPDPMDEIKSQLEKQFKELQVIEGKIDALFVALSEAVEILKGEIDGAKYFTAFQTLNLSASNIDAAYERLQFYAKAEPGKGSKREMDELAATIRNTIPNAFIAIKNNLLGAAASGENLTSLGTRIAFKATKTMAEYAEIIHTQFMYYYGLQVKALMLIIEAYHYDSNPDVARQYFNTYVGQMNEEILIYLKYAPKCTLQNTLPLQGDVTAIIAKGDKVFAQTGMENPEPKLFTINKSNLQILNEMQVPGARMNWTMVEKDGMGYMLSMGPEDAGVWFINKVALDNPPRILGTLSYDPPGSPPFKLAFVTGIDIEGDYLYILFLVFGQPGFTIKVVDLKTFTFADDIRITDELQSIGSIRGNGMKVRNGKIYTTAWFGNEGYSSLKAIDIKTKKIVQTLNTEPVSSSQGMAPMTAKGDLLYFTNSDTQLRIVNVADSKMELQLQKHVAGLMQNIIVDGYLIYIVTYSGTRDSRGDLIVVYNSPKSDFLQKTMKVGNGICALTMDYTHLYGGAGGGEKTLYFLTYAHDLTGNIIPVGPSTETLLT